MRKLYKIAILFILSLSALNAQSTKPPLLSALDTISAKNGQWISVIFGIENTDSLLWNGELFLHTPENITILGDTISAISLAGNEKIFHPVRIYITEKQLAGIETVKATLKPHNNSPAVTKDILLQIPLKRQTRIFSEKPHLVMENSGDVLYYQATLKNDGNILENLKVSFHIPGPSNKIETHLREVSLLPFSDTTITLTQKITRDILNREQYTVNIAMLDSNNNLRGNTMIMVTNISSNRLYTDPSEIHHHDNLWRKNQINMGLRDMGQMSQAITFQSRGNIGVGSGQIHLQTDYTHWIDDYIDPILINSGIGFEHSQKGVYAGSIYDNEFDIPVNGRGIQGYQTDKERNQVISFGFLEKSHNLLRDWRPQNHGYTLFFKAKDRNLGPGLWNGFIQHDLSMDGVSSNLIKNQFTWINQKNWVFEIEQSSGFSEYNDGILHRKPALALGYKTSGKINNYNFYSRSYWSNSYFPGLQRGSFIMNHSLRKRTDSHQFWATLNFYDRNPKYLNLPLLSHTNQRRLQSDLGWSLKLTPQIRMTLSPVYKHEKGNYLISWDQGYNIFQSDHFFLANGINWNTNNNQHHFTFSTENGIAMYSFAGQPKFYNRSLAQWNHSVWNLNIQYQHSSRYLSEAIHHEYRNESRTYESWIFSASIFKGFLREKLQTQLQFAYQKNNVIGENLNLTSLIRWKINRVLELSGSIVHYHYLTSTIYDPIWLGSVSMGLNLPDGRRDASRRRGKITVLVYYDHNGNGVFDEGDEIATDQIIRINQTGFMTDHSGKIQYKNVPYGTYQINIDGIDWYTPLREFRHEDKKTIIQVPLQGTGILKGKIILSKTGVQHLQREIQLAGISIDISDRQGKTWKVLTNTRGQFSIQLPANTYQITADPSTLPENSTIIQETKEIKISKNESSRFPDIFLEVKAPQVKTKRFGFD